MPGTLLMRLTRGLGVVVTTTMVLMLVRGTSIGTMAMRTVTTRFVPSLDYNIIKLCNIIFIQ
jgi:hypothetical protein